MNNSFKIRPLTARDVCRITGKNPAVIHTIIDLEDWPGRPTESERGKWQIPHEFVIKRFGVTRDDVIQYLLSGSAKGGAR